MNLYTVIYDTEAHVRRYNDVSKLVNNYLENNSKHGATGISDRITKNCCILTTGVVDGGWKIEKTRREEKEQAW